MVLIRPSPPIMWPSGRFVYPRAPAVVGDHRSFWLWSCHLLRMSAPRLFFRALVTLFWPEASSPTQRPNGSSGPIEAFGKVLPCVRMAAPFLSLEICVVWPLLTCPASSLNLSPLGRLSIPTFMPLPNWFPLSGVRPLH